MARATVLSNTALAVCRRVRSIVTTKTARRIRVSKTIRIGSPGDLEVGKYIAVINGENRLSHFRDLGAALCIDLGIALLVVGFDRRRNLLRGVGTGRIIELQRAAALLLDERQIGRHFAEGEGAIECAVRQREGVSGPVVTVDALHGEFW